MKIKNQPVQVKAGPDDGLEEGQFVMYASTFTRTPDSYGDVVAKGAFADDIKAWEESGNQRPVLYGHRMDDPEFFVGGVLEAEEDDHGYRVKGQFDLENPKAVQTYRLAKGKRLNQCSFAYDVIDEAGIELDDGTKANELRKMKVYEVSIVPIGANQDTEVVAVKAAADSLTVGVKAGRAISSKNESELRAAHESIGRVLAALDPTDDQEKASGNAEVKSGASDEERCDRVNGHTCPVHGVEHGREAKSSVPDEEPKSSPPAERLAAQAHTYALTGAGGGSQ